MNRDAHGSVIDAADLPKHCKPPYHVSTIWKGEHRGWRIVVSRIEGDPLPHVIASGMNPNSGLFEAHAERQTGATPTTVRAWVDRLTATSSGGQT